MQKLLKILPLLKNMTFFILIGIRFELIAKGKRCAGGTVPKGFFTTVEKCVEVCVNMTFLFEFGVERTDGCDSRGCKCYCIPGASAGSTCTQYDDINYNVYRIIQEGDISFFS